MSNLFTTYDSTDTSSAGYFRLGHIVLQIPPSDITTSRVINNDSIPILRGKNEMFTKSGQARWDVTVRWTAFQVTGTNDPYFQWEQLQDLIALTKAAPFVEVENGHLRQVFAELDPTMSGSTRLGFAIRQVMIGNHPDVVDALVVTVVMTYFNYKAYSQNFAYLDQITLK
jgi:hypothetical protein